MWVSIVMIATFKIMKICKKLWYAVFVHVQNDITFLYKKKTYQVKNFLRLPIMLLSCTDCVAYNLSWENIKARNKNKITSQKSNIWKALILACGLRHLLVVLKVKDLEGIKTININFMFQEDDMKNDVNSIRFFLYEASRKVLQ